MLEFKIPTVGENIKSAGVVKIHVKVGDSVKKDQDLLELETDKATIPIPSPVDGVIKDILVKVGDTVKIGATAFKIEPGTAVSSAASKTAATASSAGSSASATSTATAVAPAATPAGASSLLDFYIPTVGENIKSGGVIKVHVKPGDTVKKDQDLFEMETDKATIPIPSPVNGTVKDVLIKVGETVKIGALALRIQTSGAVASTVAPVTPETPKTQISAPEKSVAAASNSAKSMVSSQPIPAQKNVPAAPSVRRFARELGVEISKVPGSGPGGRISQEDIQLYVKNIMLSGGPSGGGIAAKPLPDFSRFGQVDRQPMTKIRKVTSDHMSYCWQTIPHVTQFDKADITDLEDLRKKYSRPDRKITITPFLMKVMASALKNFPQFNASIDPEHGEIIYKKYVNIGVAVDTEFGLIVPVLRDVDKKSILDLNAEINTIAEKARMKKIMPDDLQGGSMTLTNLGGIGGFAFTPIVNWPEVCILGVARGSLEPVYTNGQFVPRLRLPLCLSYDHRLIDGADAARFLRWIAEAIEKPFMMELS